MRKTQKTSVDGGNSAILAMSRYFRMLGGALFVTAILSIATPPAMAGRPDRPGAPTNLVLSATKSGGTFAVKATWGAGTKATKYAVRLSSAGVTLDSATVTALTWTGNTTRPDGSTVKVSVTSYNGRRRGETASRSLVLPDLTAPTASYAVTHDPAPDGPNVTVAVNSLTDNLTPTAEISQVIDWGDGGTPEPWASSLSSISHPYPLGEGRYEAQVTVTDQAANQRVYPLIIVVEDHTAPTGAYALATPTAWARWTKVHLAQAALADNLSPADKIARVISWGDGAQTIWMPGTTPAHVYAASGAYSPTVTLTDEAGNSSPPLATSTVQVTADTARPTIRLTPPTTGNRHVASWRTLKGRAADAQTGVRNVALQAIQKRGTTWYAYRAGTHSWVKAATRAAAWTKATAASVRPSATGTWAVKLAHLCKGRLLYKARAYDNVANASGSVSKKALLTKR